MRLVLGTFARTGIEAVLGRDLATGVRTALRHYADRERSATAELFDRGCLQTLGRNGADVELALDIDTEEALRRRAREHGGITMEQLAAHAVLVYLADRDAQPTANSR